MQASSIMTPSVITVAPDTPLGTVIELMLKHRIRGLPVIDGNTLVGIVTESDLLHRPETGAAAPQRSWLHLLRGEDAKTYVRSHGMTAGEVMTAPAATVEATAPVEEVAALLETRSLDQVSVLRDGRLAGIITRSDLLRALASRIAPPPLESDAEIAGQLHAELSRHPAWAPSMSELRIIVQNGVVHFWGYVRSDAQRAALHAAAERVAGVHHVKDHTAMWHEPDPIDNPNWPQPARP
jgi:CBS domain-containing protein